MTTPSVATPFWEILGLKLPADLLHEAPALNDLLATSQLKLAVMIRDAATSGQSTVADARALEDFLLQQIDRDARNKRTVIQWLRITYAAIAAMNRAGATIHPTRLAIDIEPPKSPFQVEQTGAAARAQLWEQVLHHWIRDNVQNDSNPPPAFQKGAAIALSAALCGGLLEPKKLLALVHRAAEPIRVAGSLAYYAFESFHAGVKVKALRRWHPDPVSEGLLAQWGTNDTLGQLPEKTLIEGIRQVVGVANNPPRSLAGLVTSAAALWTQRASLVDVGVARGSVLAQSLKLPAWLRQQRAHPFDNDKKNASIEVKQGASKHHGDNEQRDDPPLDVDLALSFPWIPELLALVDDDGGGGTVGEQRKRRQIAVEKWQFGPEDQWAQPYKTWALALLGSTNTSGDVLALSTVRQYFRTVVTALIGMVGAVSPATLPAGELDAWYGDVLEPIPPGKRRITMASGIREFHVHLQKTYGVAPINVGDVLGKESELATVDARIVNPDELAAARRWLEARVHDGEFPELMRAISLVLMLTFACGLRRMEVLMLRIGDLHPAADGDLRVVPHAARRLKSRSSERNLPLRVLLTETERADLFAWWQKRRAEVASLKRRADEQYLFAIPLLGLEMLPPETTLNWIHKSLRKVTGDDAVHLHHLRHSFATWTYLRLRISSYPPLAEHFRAWPLTYAMLTASDAFVRDILPGHRGGVRSAAYATARLLGHSGPGISFEHYIHCTDLLWLGLSYRHAQRLPKPLLIAATGNSRMTGYRRLDKSLEALIRAMRAKWKKRYSFHPEDANSERRLHADQGPAMDPVKLSVGLRLRRISSVLHYHDNGDEVPEIARKVSMDPDEAQWIVDRALQLTGRIQWFPRDGRQQVRLCPPTWKGPKAKQFAFGMENALDRLLKSDPALAIFGLRCALARFNPQRKDIVFRSFEEVEEARRFLSFVDALGPSVCRWVPVVRDTDTSALLTATDETNNLYLKWKSLLNLPETLPKSTGSPNSDRPAYRQWLGFHVMSSENTPFHLLMIGVFMLSLIDAEKAGQMNSGEYSPADHRAHGD